MDSSLTDRNSGYGMAMLEGLNGLMTQSVANLALGGSWVDMVLDAYFEMILGADNAATKQIVNTYADAMRYTSPMLADFLDDLTKMPQPLNEKDVFNGRKWKNLQSAMDETIGAYSPKVQRIIASGQMSTIALANDAMDKAWVGMALDLNDPDVIARWHKMPERAYADMVGRLQNGSPLSDLLDTMPAQTNLEMRRGLLKGIALGENADLVGKRVARATQMPAWKAVSISRTTMLNTYRETSRRSYLQHPDIIDGWYWQSAQNQRTCMACLMRDGTVYPLSEKQAAHSQCRCRMRPRFRNNENKLRENGREWFNRQNPDVQMKMLGPKAHKAWQSGEIDLADLAGFAIDPQFGAYSTRRSLSEAKWFAKEGRPFHPRDYPPGWARPNDVDILQGGVETALQRLEETKAYLGSINKPPVDIEDFVACMGH